MEGSPVTLAILFADICDSTRLYEKVGDARALELAGECLRRLAQVTEAHGGRVIKTMGDGIMSTFRTADTAYDAAVAMQDGQHQQIIQIRIGFHLGPVIPIGDDVFGDAVNLAARLQSLARPGEILLTRATVAALSSRRRMQTEHLDTTTVRGKRDTVDIFRIITEQEDATVTSLRFGDLQNGIRPVLVLTYQGQQIRIEGRDDPFVLGRDARCHLVVPSEYASRRHAYIEQQRDRFILTDQSTNGTYIQTADKGVQFLKREALQLVSEGGIALGITPMESGCHLIRFRIETT